MSQAPKPLYPLPYWVAHTPSELNRFFHNLVQHAQSVAEKAQEFAEPLGFAEIAYFLGILHDLGKFREEFQQYLLDCYEREQKKQPPPPRGSAPHKQAGALAAIQMLGEDWGQLLALPLYGHHGGMIACRHIREETEKKTCEAEVQTLLARAAAVDPVLTPQPPNLTPLKSFIKDAEGLEMCLRLIYSCLVDADGLDTEEHTDPDSAERRPNDSYASLQALLDTLNLDTHEKQRKAEREEKSRAVNAVRKEVYEACLEAGNLPVGFFDLTVPTGGGKTRSSLAFALQHAVANKQRRIIYAIPYTSIIDQTATVFRELFKDSPDVLLEHHSAIDWRDRKEDESAQRLAAQNWDAPLIVTTTVQLFESLYSNRPSACRKLHRIANSVLILDEAQCLPTSLMIPIRSALKTLVEHFGVSVVFCTATQPAHDLETSYLKGIEAHPIITPAMKKRHFGTLRRVQYRYEPEAWSWDRVAQEMSKGNDSCLCVVNTRKQALDLLKILDPTGENEDVLHLSTLLCGEHRKDVIAKIQRHLKNGVRTLLVSTQVIEAGVDLDFPRAMRAMGPLERIIQTAGRCNREGKREAEESEVTIFIPEEGASPRGHYRMALAYTLNLFKANPEIDLDDPEFVTRYFRKFYGDVALDKKQIGWKVQERRKYFDYPEVARLMRLIEENTVSVLVNEYDREEAEAILMEARRVGKMTRSLWRRAQPLCVSIYAQEANKSDVPIQEVFGLKVWQGKYNAKYGIPLQRGIADTVYDPSALIG